MSANFETPNSQLQRSRRLRFSLATLLIAVIPLGVTLLWLRTHLESRSLDWTAFSAPDLKKDLATGKNVLVSFAADWSLTSAMNEQQVFGTPEICRLIRQKGVVAMRADHTNPAASVDATLASLGQNTVPVIAVYRASSPNNPIVLQGPISSQQLVDALNQL